MSMLSFAIWNIDCQILAKHEWGLFGLTLGGRCFIRTVATASVNALRGRWQRSIDSVAELFWQTERFATMSTWPVLWNIELHTLAEYEQGLLRLGMTFGWRCFRSISPSSMNASKGGRQMKWVQSTSSAAWDLSWKINYVNVTFCN